MAKEAAPEELLLDTLYEGENAFWRLKPYASVFQTYAKKRWLDRDLLEVLTAEFVRYSPEYYKEKVKHGGIKINGKSVAEINKSDSLEYTIRNNDRITHETSMEENIILARPVQVISDADDLLVVEKPSGVPVHAGGSYKHCTLVGMLEAGRWVKPAASINVSSSCLANNNSPKVAAGTAEVVPASVPASSSSGAYPPSKVAAGEAEKWYVEGKARHYTVPKLHTTHRLDRLTSGLVLLATSKQRSQKIFSEFKEDKIRKTYLCRVKGNFFDLEAQSIEMRRKAGLKLQIGKPSLDDPSLGLDPDLAARLADELDLSGDAKDDLGRFCAELEGWIKCIDFKIGVQVFLDNLDLPKEVSEDEQHAAKRRKKFHPEQVQHESPKRAEKKFDRKEKKTSEANEPKWSRTRFFPVLYDEASDTSIVVAQPKTGRTHQIRVHLQRLGFEIANDPSYGPAEGTYLELKQDYPRFPGGHRSGIFLHAWQYEGPGWKYRSTVPWWCKTKGK